MTGETTYLLETQPLDSGGNVTNVFFSMGLADESELRSNGQYPVRLSQAYTHETSIFEDNSPGQTSVSLGSATINNVDGRFDYLLSYAWDNRPVTIKRGTQGSAYGAYVTEFVGATAEITADTNFLTLTLKDNSYKLLKPVQNNKFAGTGGAEGGVDIQNKLKPLLFGKARNMSPVWIDQAMLTMQIHDGAVTSVDAVYDRANKITFFQNYTTYANLVGATIPPGYYGTCTTGGYIRLGAPPAGTLTVDAVGAFGSVTNVPDLAKQILLTRLGLTSGELDTAAFTQASADAPWNFEGVYYPEPQLQYDELIELLSNMVFGFWYVTRAGLICFKIFKFNTPVASIRAEDLMSLGKAPSPAPLYRVKVDYAKNATIQPPSDFTIPRQLINAYLDRMYHRVDTTVGSPNYSGAGKYHVFLNDTEVNDLGLATFSIPNNESWITINQTGDITVTAPPTSSASAVVRANIGEFAWDETFTVEKDSSAPFDKIELTFSADRLVFDDVGNPSPAVQNISVLVTPTGTTAPITLSAKDNLGSNVPIVFGNTIPIGNVSSSPLVLWVEVRAVDANGVQQRKRFIVQHGNDGTAQGILSSFAAGGATFYFQNDEPSGSFTVNDVWVDLNDSNKTYRWTGASWVQFSDARIVDAITAAAGAQATADGKIKTYVATSAPTGALSLGDLWYNPTTQELKRWDGTAWSDIVSTVGSSIGVDLRNGPAIVIGPEIINSAISLTAGGVLTGAGGGEVVTGIDWPSQDTTFRYDYTGSAVSGEFSRDFAFKLFKPSGQVTSGITWTYEVVSGTVNTFTSASGVKSMSGSGTGTLTVSSLGTPKASVRVTASYIGSTWVRTIELSQYVANAPVSGGSGTPSTIASDTTFSAFSSTSFVDVSGTIPATQPSGVTSATVNIIISAKPAGPSTGSWTAELKLMRFVSGSWSQVGSTQSAGSYYIDYGTPSEPDDWGSASFSVSIPDTGLTGGTSYDRRIEMRLTSGSRSHTVTGSVTVVA